MAAFDVSDGGIGQPAVHAFKITPSDTVELDFVTRYIHVGTGGTLTVVMLGGETVTLTAATGSMLHMRVKQVKATGTAAVLLVGLY
jgi:hypothetical protein